MSANNARIGFDIEGAVRDPETGELLLGAKTFPDKENAVIIKTSLTHSNVRLYHDGAVAEVGTDAAPPTCLAFVMDAVRAGLWALGCEHTPATLDSVGNHVLDMRDMVPINKELLVKAPRSVTVSGCNPRFCCDSGEQAPHIRNYRRFIVDHGIPCGGHVHFGNATLYSTGKKLPIGHIEEDMRRIQALVVYCLTAYAAMGVEGSIERWKAFGTGMFRIKPYGLEWTDLGIGAYKNMLLIAGILGAARSLLLDFSDKAIDTLLEEHSFAAANKAILSSPEAAALFHVNVHKTILAMTKSKIKCASTNDDTVPWHNTYSTYESTSAGKTISDLWLASIEKGAFPTDKFGMWTRQQTNHTLGLHSGFSRAIDQELI